MRTSVLWKGSRFGSHHSIPNYLLLLGPMYMRATIRSRWAPKLRRLDLSANPFPARAAAYASRSALRARRQDGKNNNPVLFNEPPVKVDSLQFAADGTPKRLR